MAIAFAAAPSPAAAGAAGDPADAPNARSAPDVPARIDEAPAAADISGRRDASGADLLRGPSAAPPAHPPRTIVERSFDGRIAPIEGEVEVAALRALDLSPEQRETLDAIVSRRITFFDSLVVERWRDLEQGFAALGQIESAANAPERFAAISTFAYAWDAFTPWRDRGTAIDEMAEHLSPAQQRSARRLVLERHRAVVAERAADLGLARSHGQVQAHVRLERFGQLLQESFERQARGGEADLERAVKALQLTPDQTERARAIFGRLAEKQLRGEASHWDRFRAISDFMRELSPAQRARAWRYALRNG